MDCYADYAMRPMLRAVYYLCLPVGLCFYVAGIAGWISLEAWGIGGVLVTVGGILLKADHGWADIERAKQRERDVTDFITNCSQDRTQ